MTKSEIIDYIMEQGWVELYTKNLHSLGLLREDFQQEIWLMVLELPEDRLQDLYDRKTLKFYIKNIVKFQLNNHKNPFWRKYKFEDMGHSQVEVDNNDEINDYGYDEDNNE